MRSRLSSLGGAFLQTEPLYSQNEKCRNFQVPRDDVVKEQLEEDTRLFCRTSFCNIRKLLIDPCRYRK